MKFLEELKAAQEVIDRFFSGPLRVIDWTLVSDEDDVLSLAAVLRRIPQLIDALEWVESSLAAEEIEGAIGSQDCLDQPDYGPCRMTLKTLLSKLEGKK